MNQMILFFMRDFIGKIIKQYIRHKRDIKVPDETQAILEAILKDFENWLYLVTKNEKALWKDD